MTLCSRIALAAVCTLGVSTASAATITNEQRIAPSTFSDRDAACSTPGPSAGCNATIREYRPITLEAFDESLGQLNSIRLDYAIGANLRYILRGDGLRTPLGSFTSTLGVYSAGADQVTGQLFRSGALLTLEHEQSFFDGFENQTTRNNSVQDSRTSIQFSPSQFETWQTSAAARSLFFGYELTAGLLDPACIVLIGDANPCGATNRITSFKTTYDLGPVQTNSADFWWARVTYNYTPVEEPGPDAVVPLPAAGILLASALALLGLRRRRAV